MHIRSAAGEILVLNAGAASGLYDPAGSGTPVAPALIPGFPPAFTITPTQVGALARVYAGDWSPIGTQFSVTFGYISGGDFVPVQTLTGNSPSFTLTPAFDGHVLAARVVATHDGISAAPILVNSGQMISGANTDWPANIAAADWTAVEVRDAAPAGRRRITVSPSVTIPAGYHLRLFSGTASGVTPDSTGAILTPGAAFTTIGSVPVGSACFNTLGWHRIADNAIQMAHPVAEQKSFTILGLDYSNTFPPDIAPSQWSAQEIRDTAPEGRRTITLASTVVIPTGFRMRLYSFLTPVTEDTIPDATWAQITPGQTYSTVGTVSTGSTVYNAMAWERIADAQFALAHPATDTKSFTMLGLEVGPPPTGPVADPSVIPNIIVSDLTAVRSAVLAKISAGFSNNDDYVIGLNASSSGTLNLNGVKNPHATRTGRRIIIRSVGVFSHYDCSVRHTGMVDLRNARGIWMNRFRHITGTHPQNMNLSGSTLCGVERCMIDGITNYALINPAVTVGGGGTDQLVNLDNAVSVTVRHNLIRGVDAKAVSANGCRDNPSIHGNVLDWVAQDDWKLSGNINDFEFVRNWRARRKAYWGDPGYDPHEDFVQHEGRTMPMYGNTCWGNVSMLTPAWGWHGVRGSDNGTNHQELFWQQNSVAAGGGGVRSWRFEQNILFSTNATIHCANFAPEDGIGYARDNGCFLIGNFANQVNGISGPFVSNARNILVGYFGGSNTPSYRSDNKGQGTDGIFYSVGNIGVKNYSIYSEFFLRGIPFMANASGTAWKPMAQTMLDAIEPRPGTRMHWLWPDIKVGPTERLREIFDRPYREAKALTVGYGLVPGDVGWPVAKIWNDTHNANNYVDCKITRSSTYDANGDLVGA